MSRKKEPPEFRNFKKLAKKPLFKRTKAAMEARAAEERRNGRVPDTEDGEYDVGFRKPPRTAQFKKGASGNPKGRPRGSKDFVAAVSRELNRKVVIVESGKHRSMSKIDVIAMQLVNKAAQGYMQAVRELTKLIPLIKQLAPPPTTLAQDDEVVLMALAERLGLNNNGDHK